MLVEVAERLGEALGHAGDRPASGSPTRSACSATSTEHSEPLVPPELRRAGDELERGLHLISGGAAAVADIGARL